MRTITRPMPKIERVLLDPDAAHDILAGNHNNRTYTRGLIRRLAATITAGEYLFNGQPIQVAADGTLLDGQHRLMACVLAQVPIDTLIIWNATLESQETMDLGKARTVADILRLRGHKNQSAIAALSRRIALAEAYGPTAALNALGREVSPGQVLRAAELLGDIPRYTSYAKSIADMLYFGSGLTAYLIWWLDSIDRTDSEYFWEKLRTGEGLHEGDAIYALRQFGLHRTNAHRGSYTHKVQSAGVILKAWNKFRAGDVVKVLSFKPGGSRAEAFPEPV